MPRVIWVAVVLLSLLTLPSSQSLKCVNCFGKAKDKCATKPPPPTQCPRYEQYCSNMILFVDNQIFSLVRGCTNDTQESGCYEVGTRNGYCSYYCSTDGCNRAGEAAANFYFVAGMAIVCGMLSKL